MRISRQPYAVGNIAVNGYVTAVSAPAAVDNTAEWIQFF